MEVAKNRNRLKNACFTLSVVPRQDIDSVEKFYFFIS